MARPKRDSDTPSAQEKLEAAFWQLLSEKPYESITVSELAHRAGVNHNTIYYHYESIDDMAMDFFDKGIPEDIAGLFDAVINRGLSMADIAGMNANVMIQWRKAYLFLKSDSRFLMQHLRKRMTDYWCQSQDIQQESLTDDQKLDLEFIFTGMSIVIKYAFDHGDPMKVGAFMNRPLGIAALKTLKELKAGSDH